MLPNSPRRRWLYWFSGLILLAIVGGWFGSVLIRRAYQGTAPPAINDLITGQSTHPVEFYVNAWWRLVVAGTVMLIVIVAVVALAFDKRGAWREAVAHAAARLPDFRNREVVWLALMFGLIGGLAEALRWIFEYSVLHRVTAQAVTADLLWKIPIAASTFVALCAVFVIALAALLPRGLGALLRGVAPAIFAWIAAYSFLSALTVGIHWIARIILAAGVAIVVHRRASDHPRAFARLAARASAVLAVGLMIIAATIYVTRRHDFRESVARTRLTGTKAPNIVFIIWDTVRAASLTLYGYSKPTTPNLDALGSDGVVFDRAIAAAPWTLPSHASLFTGLYHHQHSATRTSALNDIPPTLAEVLGRHGYQTAGFVANTYWLGRGFGLDRGFKWYEDRPPTTVASVMKSWWAAEVVLTPVFKALGWDASERITAARVNGALLDWIDAQESGTPFFAFVNWFDAHEPYVPPDNFGYPFSKGTPLSTWSWLSDRRYPPEKLAELREAYEACINYLDHQLGMLVAELERRGLRDNTLIVISSDHGETIGEQDARVIGHENNVYYNVLHVPLVVAWKGHLQPRRVPDVVSLVDVPATIVDLVSARGSRSVAGSSLVPLMAGARREGIQLSAALSQGNPAEYHVKSKVWPMAKGPLYSVVAGDHHYIINARGEESVYDYSSDPWEQTVATNSPGAQAALPMLRSLISRVHPPGGR